MSNGFNKVVIMPNTQYGPNNLHIVVHPFKLPTLYMFMHKGHKDYYLEESKLPERFKPLAANLWNNIPGLQTLFFGNGTITIQHVGIFPDEDIFQVAREIIFPFLALELSLSQLDWKDE